MILLRKKKGYQDSKSWAVESNMSEGHPGFY